MEEKGFDQLFPNAKLIATVDTGLPTEEIIIIFIIIKI